jgi:hypothetical protein
MVPGEAKEPLLVLIMVVISVAVMWLIQRYSGIGKE